MQPVRRVFRASTRSCRAEIVFGCNGGQPRLCLCFRAGADPSLVRRGNQPTLEIRHCSKDMEHLLADSGGSIDSLLQADQIDLSGFDVRDPTLLPFTSPLGLDDTILSRDFDRQFWCRRAPNCTTAAHRVRHRVKKMSKLAKCSSLAGRYEQSL